MERQAGFVPGIFAAAPAKTPKVTYPSGVYVELGQMLTPTQVKDQPDVSWEADPNALYVLAMIDSDVISHDKPVYLEFCHWLVINIPGNKLTEGQTVVEYVGPGPPLEDYAAHRYLFLIYEQSDKIVTDKFVPHNSRKGRLLTNLETRDYAELYKLGNPIAGTFFRAEYDDYVPIWRAQFEEE